MRPRTQAPQLQRSRQLNKMRLMIKLHSKESKNKDITAGIDHLNIV